MRKIRRLLLLSMCTLFYFHSFAQEVTVSGIVTDASDNSPLPKVSVRVKGKSGGVNTNDAGYFSIKANKGQTLVFSFVGYANKEISVGDAATINVSLSTLETQLGEVVVTAYDIKRNKREMTYQTTTIAGSEIASTRRENFINSLAGRIPGATITSTTGMPGSSATIVLRGPTSIDGNNQPLFVVDGLIIDNSSFEMQDRIPGSGGLNLANRSNDFGNRAMDINPEDIETVTVLKGPEATALYGSDGANGAIIITTKKGKKGQANVSYNGNFRWEKVYRLPEIQTEFGQGSAGVNNSTVRTYFGQRIPLDEQIFDNINSFFRTGKSQQHNIAVDGGSDVGTYRFTGSYINQEGVVPNTGFQRYNFRLNTTFKLNPKMNITNSFAYINSRTDKASKGSGGFLLSLLSWPVTDDIREYITATGNRKTIRGDLLAAEDDNPFWDVNKNINYDINDRLQANINFSYDITKWLNLTAIHGIDFYTTKGTWFNHPQSNVARTVGGILQQWNENQRLINGVYRATVRKKIGKVNNTVVGAVTFDTRKLEVNAVKGERFFDAEFVSMNNTDPLTIASITTNVNYNRFGSFINYTGSFNNWLNISATGRMDGSSRLVDPVNYQLKDALYYYWSAGMSIVFSDLIKSLPKEFNYGKLRVNYATTGRDPSAPYVKGNRFSTSTFTGGGFTPFVTQGNPNLRPEFSQQFETGVEMKFLANRLSVDFAYYDNRTKDQLINPRISYASGAILQWINGGTVQNRGIEFAVTGTPVRSKNFTWDATVNFGRNRNKILEMPAGLPQFYNSDTWIANIRNIAVQGGSIFQLAANRFDRNGNGDLVISQTTGLPVRIFDYTVVADRQPDFLMGIINNFTFFQDFNLSFNLDVRVGGDVYNGTEEFLYLRGLSKRTLDRETPRVVKGVLNDGLQNTTNPTPNTIVVTPLFRSDYYSAGTIAEDFIERDVNWVRLRDITFAYNIPSKLLKKQRVIKSAAITFTGTDLFILTNYSGADPSANANNAASRGGIGGVGLDFGNLATPRGLNFGIRAQF
ncbi:SusC/RagA family TonB-linked outer membrane protein [Lacibacter sp.]|uniref:SusC/RagA family TonB-linked outer membrane protein n=1 Tax=Lacibacter sp. TaxID=1915409 RepID=UPI002B4B26E1|nr:SusC/RagA family TonB-linked outer membrane protein [Lacibacter sp.]HLP36546.1 SusC/RagA family TonB-linked outer membrane protein [Lacibacter sp.]